MAVHWRDARSQRCVPARYLVYALTVLVILGLGNRRSSRETGRGEFKGGCSRPLLLVDTVEGRIVQTKKFKERLWSGTLRRGLKDHQITLDSMPKPPRVYESDLDSIIDAPEGLRLIPTKICAC